MTKNLLKQIMEKPVEKNKMFNTEELIKKIEDGYTVNRVPKFQKKKTFAPSTIVYGHGECPRYWYLAFEGATFADYATPYGVANMTSGTLSHGRIQNALMASGIAKVFKDDNGQDTTEFKITYPDPPIFGYGDGLIEWAGEELVLEIKTMQSDAFDRFKMKGKGKKGHLVQLLIYMKILGKAKGILMYENKNTHELLIFPVEVNDDYRKWIDYLFDWMKTVRKAWTDKTIPKKNYRSNSKICKECPVKEACDNAEVGEIKIASLEELSETV